MEAGGWVSQNLFVINIYGGILLAKKSLMLSDFLYLEEERWRVSMEEEEESVEEVESEEEEEEEVEERGATEEVAATWNDNDDGWEGGPHCALGQPQAAHKPAAKGVNSPTSWLWWLWGLSEFWRWIVTCQEAELWGCPYALFRAFVSYEYLKDFLRFLVSRQKRDIADNLDVQILMMMIITISMMTMMNMTIEPTEQWLLAQ